MLSILIFGFLIGLQHAFEADHLAAVSSMASSKSSVKNIIRRGAFWGIGHTVMLFIVAGSFLTLGYEIPAGMERTLEGIVGVMLVLLGLHVFYKMRQEKIHIHAHSHEGTGKHLHAHTHKNSNGKDSLHKGKESMHEHRHSKLKAGGSELKVFFVGLIHGTAGSAALLALTVTAVKTPLIGLLYILIFGLGSILGMVILSSIIALPLKLGPRYLNFAHQSMQLIVGAGTVGVGLYIFVDLGFI